MHTPLPLKVLMVEDSPADAELVLRALRDLEHEFEHVRVASEAALRDALTEFAPDVILSDFSMPGFSGQEALTIACELAPQVPFLFVSGTIGEELAIQALQRGALDYVLKDNLRRLPSSITRALHITRNRQMKDQMEHALCESEERFRSIVENSKDWIWENEWSTRTTYSNGAIAQILGYGPEELIGTLAAEHMLEEDREEVMRRMPELVAAGQGWHRWRLRWRHRDGSIRVLESTAVPRMDAGGEVIGYRGVDQDITELLQQERKIRQMARLQAVLASTSSAVLRAHDRDAVLKEACRVAVEKGGFRATCIGHQSDDGSLALLGYHGDPEVTRMIAQIGRRAATIDDPMQQTAGMRALRSGNKVISPDLAADGNLPEWVRTCMASVGIASQAVVPIGNPPWAVLGLYAGESQAFGDDEVALVERLASEIDFAVAFLAKSERLEYLAYHNPVTGQPNRSAYREQVALLLEQGPVVVAVLDVQRFAHVNESRGRAFGDALLRQIGQRLQTLVGVDGVLAHAEADSFLLAYRAMGSVEDEKVRLDALIEAFERESFVMGDEETHVALHGGFAIGPDHGSNGEGLERNAMAALTEGDKRSLRLYAFSEDMQGRAQRRTELERDLYRALEAHEFELFYQPKIDTASQRVVAAEALLRWNHPRRGLVSPAEFIPILEETGMIVAVGHWVLGTALETAAKWRSLGHHGFRICVNVSARELRNPRFLDDCRALLQPHAGDQMIDIELTESLLMEDIQHSVRLLEGVRALGCKIAIDDFGTGYSSLNYLARLPVDTLKIDQSFVAQLTQSPQTLGLVTNIIGLAHSLSLDVVAEGVETEEQAKLLRLLRCDVLQGYLFGRPMPTAQFATQILGQSHAAPLD